MNASATSYSDKRSEGRFVVGRRHVADLGLRTESGRMFTVHAIRDVSRTGISLVISDAIEAGAAITIDYRDHGVRLEIKGNVAWCRERTAEEQDPRRASEYVIGLSVRSPLLLTAFLQS